jgi:hypothetical protein
VESGDMEEDTGPSGMCEGTVTGASGEGSGDLKRDLGPSGKGEGGVTGARGDEVAEAVTGEAGALPLAVELTCTA